MEKINVNGEVRIGHVVADGTITINLDRQFTFSFQSFSTRTTLYYPSGELLAAIYSGADVSNLTPAQATLCDLLFFFAQQLNRVWRYGSAAGAQLTVEFGSASVSNFGESATLSLSLPADKEQARSLREALAPLR